MVEATDGCRRARAGRAFAVTSTHPYLDPLSRLEIYRCQEEHNNCQEHSNKMDAYVDDECPGDALKNNLLCFSTPGFQ